MELVDCLDPPSHGFGAASGMDLVGGVELEGGSGNDAVPQVRKRRYFFAAYDPI